MLCLLLTDDFTGWVTASIYYFRCTTYIWPAGICVHGATESLPHYTHSSSVSFQTIHFPRCPVNGRSRYQNSNLTRDDEGSNSTWKKVIIVAVLLAVANYSFSINMRHVRYFSLMVCLDLFCACTIVYDRYTVWYV